MMDNFETELVIMGTKVALSQYKLPLDPDEIKCFDDFHAKYGKFIKRTKKFYAHDEKNECQIGFQV